MIAADAKLRAKLIQADPAGWVKLLAEHAAALAVLVPRRIPAEADAEPLRQQTLDDLHRQVGTLTDLSKTRRDRAYRFGCAVGKYLSLGALSETEIVEAFCSAWTTCGAVIKHRGMAVGLAQLHAGLDRGRSDPPPAICRRYYH